MNIREYQSASYQRVYQYLVRYSAHTRGNLDSFRYSGKVEGSDRDCLGALLR